jgi:uncharacterized integral membrane protein
MQRLANWLLWIVVVFIVVLATLNWNTLNTPAPLDLLIMRIDAPLGVIMLGLTSVLIVLSFVATLRNQIGSLLEHKRLNKEIRRLQSAEDQAASKEIATLRTQMQEQFDRINQRLDAVPAPVAPDSVSRPGN